MMQRLPAKSLERSWQRYKQIRTIAWPRQQERPRKHILSPQSINFAPSVNLGRRTSHSPARSLFNDIWAIFLSRFGDFSDFSYFFHGLDWGAVLEVLWITATQGLQGIEQGIVQGRREERISTLVTFFKNDGTVAAAKQMLNSSDDDIKTAKERLSMIEE